MFIIIILIYNFKYRYKNSIYLFKKLLLLSILTKNKFCGKTSRTHFFVRKIIYETS